MNERESRVISKQTKKLSIEEKLLQTENLNLQASTILDYFPFNVKYYICYTENSNPKNYIKFT
jgi:hypothetical protein